MLKHKKICLAVLAGVLIIAALAIFIPKQLHDQASAEVSSSQTKRQVKKNNAAVKTAAKRPKDFWQRPSESKPYPDLTRYPNVNIDVSIPKQRVYIKDGKKTLYTMLASTGKDDGTPKGHFNIQHERGLQFFNEGSKEGAKFWVSFKDHGIYLFHSVPINGQGDFDVKQAESLGGEANSHGCIRLSVADAKWFFENVKEDTPVYIH
ncbi:cell surface protein [Agrilactobacillus composti DSM 18527 = JCM 14202]|uniref:Cell surface protein n=1 Tax=Agrilactobacillus composti DSM 18527 = JCM 14202 TaxID=1423734 RepID=X0PEP5_9LACO|nr:L,D-transpeptidase [Agrilactobacillus composti]KRM35150.1 cell surface protein [Agrilactobacillus composti DSM 18527 = JCM 14202]GAF40224.1 D-alanyl-D-alanine carboxypeptidase [Agrilactobacillus composti DSM 18527 = JCM 14202]